MRFLGGKETYEREIQNNDVADQRRGPEQLFYDLVVPYYGNAEFLRNRSGLLSNRHPVWQIVRAASAMT